MTFSGSHQHLSLQPGALLRSSTKTRDLVAWLDDSDDLHDGGTWSLMVSTGETRSDLEFLIFALVR